MIEKILDTNCWNAFLEHKLESDFICKREKKELKEFIENEKYLPIAEKIMQGSYEFSTPRRAEINKMGKKKKRVVYTFPEDENIILKFIAYLLSEYDGVIADNCYAFRLHIGPRNAFLDMKRIKGVRNLWCFKTDISDYFNSIDVPILMSKLKKIIEDEKLFHLLKGILCADKAVYQGEVITEKRGAMAGTPIAPFLANIYLSEMDAYFMERGIPYARYSDDIVVFDTKERIKEHIDKIHRFFEQYKLTYNPEKEVLTPPGEAWTFLGFQYQNGVVDISPIATKKMMAKIRRKARSLRRWKLRKGVSDEVALKTFNKRFNKKFYQKDENDEICWSRWYFPLITTADSLHAIDLYMQQYQRYLITGKQNKANYSAVSYEMMKNCGYRPLVSEFYNVKSQKE